MAIPSYNQSKRRTVQNVVNSLRNNGQLLYKTNILISIHGIQFTLKTPNYEGATLNDLKRKYKLSYRKGRYYLFKCVNGLWEKLCCETNPDEMRFYIDDFYSESEDYENLMLAVNTVERRIKEEEKAKKKSLEENKTVIREAEWKDFLSSFISSKNVKKGPQNISYFTAMKRVVSFDYGLGTIKTVDSNNNRIVVVFDYFGEKTFIYPRCIENGNLLQILREPDGDW